MSTWLVVTGKPYHRGKDPALVLRTMTEFESLRENNRSVWSGSHKNQIKNSDLNLITPSEIGYEEHQPDCSAAIQSNQVMTALREIPDSAIVIRLRSDFTLTSISKLLGVVDKYKDEIKQGKIIITSYGTRDMRTSFDAFMFSDLFQVGQASRVRKYFSTPTHCCHSAPSTNHGKKILAAEQCWALNIFFDKNQESGSKSSIQDYVKSRAYYQDSISSLRKDYVILGLDQIGLADPAIYSIAFKPFHNKRKYTYKFAGFWASISWLVNRSGLIRFHPTRLIPYFRRKAALDPKASFLNFLQKY